MNSIWVDQVGYLSNGKKRAVLNFAADEFEVTDVSGNIVLSGHTDHFGTDEISGEDVYVAVFDELDTNGIYRIKAGDAASVSFRISGDVYKGLLKDLLKCFYYLRCGDALDPEYAGEYYHAPCHMASAKVFGEDVPEVDVTGGWHDAGDFGRYSTAGAVAVAHLLYGVRFFGDLLNAGSDIPKVVSAGKTLPDILAEVKVELDFLLKMQRGDGGVWHKVTTLYHAEFIMPEDDHDDLYLFPVSSMATADIAAVFALAYTIYKDYEVVYAERLLAASLKSYAWLEANPEPLLFHNPPGNGTGEYREDEDISNRFWAACALHEATGEDKYLKDACAKYKSLADYDAHAPRKGYQGDVFTCMGWAEVAGLGSLSLILRNENNALTDSIKQSFMNEADRLRENADKNGFNLCMTKEDFIWGSNMELLKYMMILSIADRLDGTGQYRDLIMSGIDYMLGMNSMDTSYVTGHGEHAYRHPHLRPTVADDIEEPWPGLVSGGPNMGLQDARAKDVDPDSAPMKCYLDHEECYSLNEITIYWNSPFVFVLAYIFHTIK
ncbi:MAG: glycoside hydrolase family 9 protein [Lachnospiraceae bacterium]|nr:glycoside hydrolase family 9 protein [Lachnospiraceae bacterium]